MTNTLTLYQLTAEMADLEAALIENGGELTPEMEAAWTETSEALTKKADGYGTLLNKFDAASKNIAAEIERLQALKKTADNSVKRIKAHLVAAMTDFDIQHLDGELHKFSLSTTTATETDDEVLLAPYQEKIDALQADLPAWLTLSPKISKTELKAAYKGKDVTPAGLRFVENKSLRIK